MTMPKSTVSSIPIQELPLWKKTDGKRIPLSFDLEITARCNNDCRHCYINLPVKDKLAIERELPFEDIKEIADEAVSLGALWCLITGGEPFLRKDFFDIYLYFKKKGLLVSVFTNANLITEEHIKFFKRYPPRDIEVTVYGVTEETYERVTRKKGSFSAFMQGLNLLFSSGVKVRLKAMALRSNIHEMTDIARFCRKKTKDYFRFDPLLHLGFDRDPIRNEAIKSERLTHEEIVALEMSDPERFQALQKGCDKLIVPEFAHTGCNHLFHCGAGNSSFSIGYDGTFCLCPSLRHPDCVYNLRKGNLTDAWQNFVPKIRDMRSYRKEFHENCHVCPLVNLCLWCPAHCHLETGELDRPVEYFCSVGHARADMLKNRK